MSAGENNFADMIGFHAQASVCDRLYQRISEMILSGKLEEGFVFPNETVLCEQLQVGRTTLREAYKALELSGYVTRTKRGTSVNSRLAILSATPLKALFHAAKPEDFDTFRMMLESESAFLAASGADAAEMLGELSRQSKEALARKDFQRLMELDEKFHIKIAAMSGNALIISTVTVMTEEWRSGIQRNVEGAFKENPGNFDILIDQHDAIAEAIRRHDAAAAQSEMRTHIKTVTYRQQS